MQLYFRDRKCCDCGVMAAYTQEVLGKAYCVDCYEKLDSEFIKKATAAVEPKKKNDFLCGECAKKASLSLEDRLALAKRITEGVTCSKCKGKYTYSNGKYQKIKDLKI